MASVGRASAGRGAGRRHQATLIMAMAMRAVMTVMTVVVALARLPIGKG
jgi:hypothetical protein